MDGLGYGGLHEIHIPNHLWVQRKLKNYAYLIGWEIYNKVSIGYSNLGHSGRAAYSDLNPVTNLRHYINSDLGYNDLKFQVFVVK